MKATPYRLYVGDRIVAASSHVAVMEKLFNSWADGATKTVRLTHDDKVIKENKIGEDDTTNRN